MYTEGGQREASRREGERETKTRSEPKKKERTRTLGNLFLNTSILFKNKMILVLRNHLLLITLSKRTRDSAIRFCGH
jgi:hypothetical protein